MGSEVQHISQIWIKTLALIYWLYDLEQLTEHLS